MRLWRCVGDRDRSCCCVVSPGGVGIGDSGSGVMDLLILSSGVAGISMTVVVSGDVLLASVACAGGVFACVVGVCCADVC